MKKANFTSKTAWIFRQWLLLIMTIATVSVTSYAQCDLACGGTYNLSMDDFADCSATLTPEELLNGEETSCEDGVFTVHILNEAGTILLDDAGTVDFTQVGNILQYKVLEAEGNNCWGYLVIEDKIAPVFDCEPITDPFFCYDAIAFDIKSRLVDECSNLDDITIDSTESVITNTCNGLYEPDTLMMVRRIYTATDPSGNVSEPCTLDFFVQRIPDLADIDLPENFTGVDALKCYSDFPRLPNGAPVPDAIGGSGIPTITAGMQTFPLYPNPDQFCNLLVDFEDRIIKEGCVTKIARDWTIFEWSCEVPQRSIEHTQLIEIVDDLGPQFTSVVAPFTATTSGYDCEAQVFIPRPETTDLCNNDDVTISLTYPGAPVIEDFQGGYITLPLGINELLFIATDPCDISSEATTTVTVEDNTSPVAVCDLNTVVALSDVGVAWVPAEVFDNESYDDCSPVSFKARRMDNGVPCGMDDVVAFADSVQFCCADVGVDDLMVVLRVTDEEGNYNDCMVNVNVQDKVPPAIICPPNITVECGYGFTNYDDFGTVVNGSDAVMPIDIPLESIIDYYGGVGALTDGYAIDNCDAMITSSVAGELNQCNVGTIIRTFTAEDPQGRTTSCEQSIGFAKRFDDLFSREDIEFPRDTFIDGCSDPEDAMFDPENIGFPEFNQDDCDLVGFHYEDQVFPFNNSEGEACFKILRHWKVIDWCQLEDRDFDLYVGAFPGFMKEGGPYGGRVSPVWEHTQIIKVSNSVAPTVVSSLDRMSACTYDNACVDGFIELLFTFDDDCSDQLQMSYEIDAGNDGTIDITSPAPQYGTTLDASGTYPIGSHRIIVKVLDLCGNKLIVEKLFDIVNCKAPTPYCIDGLAVSLMPMDTDGDDVIDNGMIEVWAIDFDAGSFHSCYDNVILSFSADTTEKFKEFTCADLGTNEVTIYATVVNPVTDELIQSFCVTSIEVQDNSNACTDAVEEESMAAIQGNVYTEMDEMIQGVKVTLDGTEVDSETTGVDGGYAFPEMAVGGSYSVVPAKEDEAINGVSTLDLVLIQRHILGIQELDSPYKMIASDVNIDGKISATDLLDLRKVILGKKDEFAGNKEWRFVDNDYTFDDLATAASEAFPENYDITSLSEDMTIDFTGVKIGDVNNTAEVNRAQAPTTRSRESMSLLVSDNSLTEGQIYSVIIRAGKDIDLIGMQTALIFDPESVEVLEINGLELELGAEDINYNELESGTLPFIWSQPEGQELQIGQDLVEVIVSAHKAVKISDVISLGTRNMSAEAYDRAENILELNLTIEGDDKPEFSLTQNRPNPFIETTSVSFHLPSDMSATFSLYNVSGKLIKRVKKDYNKGMNTLEIKRSDLDKAGIYYYQIEAGSFTASKKMVLLN